MVERTPWLERRFEEAVPLEMFPNLLERLRGTPARVEDRLRGLDRDTLTATAADSWSILENVGHLRQVEDLWTARLDDFEARRPDLTPARFDTRRVPDAGFNKLPEGEVCAAFRAARGRLVERLEHFDDPVLRFVARHPRLDRPMRIVDLMVFIAEHDDHHLATVTRLIEAAVRSRT